MKYLLDTTTCAVYLRRAISPIRTRLAACDVDDIVLCAPVKHELWFGALRSSDVEQNLARISAFVAPYVSLSVDDQVARRAADLRLYLVQRNQLIGSYDMLIAAIALEFALTVVTSNTQHFSRVPRLNLEDWMQ
jgi:tRNA(fMet)-specific endonuclease VapC